MSVTEERVALDELCINTIRTLSMDAVQKANSGHPGTPMALAPVAYLLYTRVMRHSPEQPDWPARDRFVLSAGHASMLLYSILHLTGYGVSLDDLKNFRQLGSPAAGHPEYGHAPGIETTTGPLGQGISTAVGMALGERMLAARFGEDLVGHFTYSIVSDGDLEEGVSAEASSIAGHLGLGRLIAFYDDNHISIEGDTALAFSEDVGKRYEAYGWHVQNLGEDIGLEPHAGRPSRRRSRRPDRPSMIILRTHIAPGSPNKQDTHEAHGAPLGEEEIRLTKQAYNWPSEEPFFIPDESSRALPRERRPRSRAATRSGRSASTRPSSATSCSASSSAGCPRAGTPRCPKKGPDAGMIATRKASNEVIQWAAAQRARARRRLGRPRALHAHADQRTAAASRPGTTSGRNFHFGIREHGMGAIVNGLNLMGLRAFGAGFLIFSDYMKGVDPPGGDHAPAVDLRVHARLDRARRGRADPPADRAARHPAGDPEPRRRAAGGLQRDRAGLAPRAAPDATGRRCWRSPARGCRCGARTACRATRSSAAPTCSRTPTAASRS